MDTKGHTWTHMDPHRHTWIFHDPSTTYQRRIPTRPVPSWLLRALSLAVPDLRRTVPLLGRDAPVSTARARDLLGMTFIPAEEALLASARSLVERGLA